MKKLLLLPLLFLVSCDVFSSTNYDPALQANAGMRIMHEELRAAFVAVVMNSKGASEEYKINALATIEANRNDFQNFSNAMEHFLVAAGDVKPERVLELAKQIHDFNQARREDK